MLSNGVHRAAMYSGTFDPPTIAHVGIMSHVARYSGIEKLLVVVNNRSSPKVFRCSAEQRRAMILAALPADAAERIDVIVEPDDGKNRMFEGLVSAHAYDWFGVVGEDSFIALPPEVRAARNWLLVTRDGSTAGMTMPNVERLNLEVSMQGVSSTRVRQLLESGGDITGLVDPGVARYIAANGLYVLPAMAALAARENMFHGLWTMLAGASAALPPPPFVPTQSADEMPNYIRRYLDGVITPKR